MVDPFTSILSGDMTSKLMLCFNCAGWDGEVFIDNTPRKNLVRLCSCSGANSSTDAVKAEHYGVRPFQGDSV
jgi:hypothetical protein